MSFHGIIMDCSLLHLRGGFDTQVSYLLENIRLSRSEVEGLNGLFLDLENVLSRKWRGCEIYPFGSIVTGLGIKTSDVDCFVALPQWEQKSPKQIVKIAKSLLAKQHGRFTELNAIPQAKVPIVKFYHVPTQRHCDVSFKTPAGVENSKLLAFLLHLDCRAIPLAVILKYWSKVYNLTGTNLIPNYGLTMLVIFYLQQVGILPPVCSLQADIQPNMIENWNTAFHDTEFTTENDDTLFQLLAGFFNYYSNFDFEQQVISPYLGKVLKRELFKDAKTVPDEFSLYKNNLSNGLCVPLKVDSKICVQDPFQHCRNCCVAVYPRLADKLLLLLRQAVKVFKDNADFMCLKQILHPEDAKDVFKPSPIQRNHINPPYKVVKRKNRQPQHKKNVFINIFEQYRRQMGNR